MTALGTSSTTITVASPSSTVVLNAIDANGVTWVIDRDGFTGWGTSGSSLQVVGKPRQPGGWAGLAYATPRYMALKGTVTAPTPLALNVALDSLYDAVSLTGATFTVAEAGFTRSLTVRRSDIVDPVRQTNWRASFQFQVVAVDPRKLGASGTGSTNLPASTGGLTVPFTIPFPINSTVVSGQISLTNPGNETGPVVLRIVGPCTGPVITHTSSSTTTALVFSSSLSLGAGEFLLIDMDKRTALANGQSSRSGYITSRGWSGFDPGVNTWSFTASGYNALSLLVVDSAIPAWK